MSSTVRSSKLTSFLALCLIACLPLAAGVAGCQAHRQSSGDQSSADSGGSGGAGQTVDYTVTEVGPAQTPAVTPPDQGQSAVQPDGQHVPVTVTTSDSVVRLGPFAYCSSLAFDPSGRFLSLVEYDYPWSRLWLVDITSETARCPLVVPSGYIHSFGFGPGGDSVYFATAGLQTAGPYEGQSGWWVGAVSADADEPATVAFIPYEREVPPPAEGDDQDNQPMVGASICGDGSAILIQDELGLPSANVRVALPSGEITRHTAGRWSSSYSPDGWWAVCGGRSLVDVRADKEVALEPPCEWPMGYSPDGSFVLGWEVVDEDIPAAQEPYPMAAVGFLLYDRTGKVAYHLSAPGEGDRRMKAGTWSPDGKSLAFAVGTCAQYHFTPQELWVWTPTTDALSKLVDISEEAAGAHNKGPAFTIEWVDSDLIRLWNVIFGWDTPCGWQDVILRAGAEGFAVAEPHTYSVPGGRRVGSRGANAVVVQQQNGVLHAHVLLVGPGGKNVIGQADAYYPPEYEHWTFDLCTKGALPYVVLEEPFGDPGSRIVYLQLVALP